MSQRLIRTVALILLGVLLVTLPGLAGCAEEKEEVPEITIGVLTDFTGTASFAVKPTINAMMDYFRMIEEENPIPGVKVKFVTYDTRLDYARTVPGYIWLKGQGAIMMHTINPADNEILVDRYEEDEIPVIGSQVQPKLLGDPWMFCFSSSNANEAEVLMKWIMDTWEYYPTPPKIGHLGWTLMSTEYHQDGIDAAMEANPGKFDWVGVERAPLGTTVWAVEIDRLKDCDFIIVSVVGPMAASFVKEARARGYEGNFLSGINAFPGYWDLVRGAVPEDELYGCYHAGHWPWWSEDVLFITKLKEAIQTYRSGEAEALMRSSGPLTGWAYGMLMVDAIKRAVEEVGAENVDGTALRNALAEIDMTVAGWGNPWRIIENENFLARAERVYEWSIAEEDWVAVSDWITPASLAGS